MAEKAGKEHEASHEKVLHDAVDEFKRITGNLKGHMVLAAEDYRQPPVYLVTHLVEMRFAGWKDADFDTLAAVSGASALFAWEPRTFMPKYAHLYIGMDDRIAQVTGFGYEWVPFRDAEDAWKILRESIDSNRPVKGWHYENLLFAGYREAAEDSERQIFTMADGPDTFARWWSWQKFTDWIREWSHGQLGRHSGPVARAEERETAGRVMKDLVEWSTQPPESVRKHFSKATFGLPGIEALADAVEDVSNDGGYFDAYASCHALNPQWTLRNSTSLYLSHVAGLFPDSVSTHVLAAAKRYRAAYEAWDEMVTHLPPSWAKEAGWKPDALENAWQIKESRHAGAKAIRKAAGHERAALAEIEKVLREAKGN